MNQNIFSGLQYLNAIKQSQLVYQASKYDLDDAKFNLTISIINAYLQVLYTHEAIAIAQNQVSSDSLQLQTVLNLVDVGKKTESDMLQIKSQMVADKYTVTNNISQWKLAKVNLQQLINIPVNETFNINYASITGPALNNLDNVSDIYAGSLAYQPIVKSYALKTQSAAYSVLIAKGAYYPQLVFKSNLGTSYSSAAKQTSTTVENTLQTIGYLQSNPSSLVLGDVPQAVTTVNNYPFGRQLADNLNANFSLTLNIPILNYLQVRNNVRRQKINLQNAELNEQITKVNLRKTIEQVFTGTENAMAQYQSANEEVEATRAAYDVASAKFDDGKIIATDLLVQKNAYIKALSDLLQAKYGLLFNRGILDYYRGTPFTF
jgi:outer membrane protein